MEPMEPRVCLDCGDILVWGHQPHWAGGGSDGYLWKKSSYCEKTHGSHRRLRGLSALQAQLDDIIASTGKSNELKPTN